MTTRFIGVKEFRQNIVPLYQEAIKKKLRFIVLNRNKPIFDIRPLSKKTNSLEDLTIEIEQARKDVKMKKLLTSKQVRKILDI